MTTKDIQFTSQKKPKHLELVAKVLFVDTKGQKQECVYASKEYKFKRWTPRLKNEAYYAIISGIKKWNK